ncbi:MAG: type II toxin-antitoxin system VapC family toxin [Actinomycetota bacterium]
MATSAEPDVLVDTSAAVALCVGDHEHHAAVIAALTDARLGLAGHAAFETFSVLTRLPAPARRAPAVVAQLLDDNFPESRYLSPDGARSLRRRLAGGEISGGAVYDGLVAAVAAEHGVRLATLDRRALDTYRVVGADIHLIDP